MHIKFKCVLNVSKNTIIESNDKNMKIPNKCMKYENGSRFLQVDYSHFWNILNISNIYNFS